MVAELRPSKDTKKPKRTMTYKYPMNFKREIKEDTQEVDELYQKLCKTHSSKILKTMFSAMLLLNGNLDKLSEHEVSENLKKMLIDQ